MTICTSCQTDNPTGMKFCGACGAALPLLCRECGFSNPADFKFCGQCGRRLGDQNGAGETSKAEEAATKYEKKAAAAAQVGGETGERRHLTVMFCDLVDSASLSDLLDPEELHTIIQQYQHSCANIINRYGGHIAQYLGDGMLIYFGFPRAHEDDARRAVHSALGCIDAIETLNKDLAAKNIELSIRIGIHTGLVVTAEIGTGERREQLALGRTPNIAARLQNLAQPNSVFITDKTYNLICGFFESESLGQHKLKGINDSIGIYKVNQEIDTRSRIDMALRLGELVPIVGRENEIEQLNRLWGKATNNQGQVILLKGESGVGKSRLMQAFIEQLNNTSHHYLYAHGTAFSESSTLRPIIEMLQETFQFNPSDSPQERLQKVARLMAKYSFNLSEDIPLFASLLNLPLGEEYQESTLSPERKKARTLEILFDLLQRLSQEHPLLLVIEDLHWLDPSTLEFLDMLVIQDPTHRIFVLFTCRPHFTIPWQSRSNLIQFNLTHLNQSDTVAMIDRLTEGRGLPKVLIDEIIVKTGGVPLFVEELTKMVIDSNIVAEKDGHYQLVGEFSSLAIPSTLQDLLAARLDSLGPVKETAQLASIIGREFSFELLQYVSDRSATVLQQNINDLINAELIFQRGVGKHGVYVFKHALIQDAATSSMLKSRRQGVHKKIATVIEAHYPEIVDERPETLAHHRTEACQFEQAVDWWLIAGQRALQQSANLEAINHLERGLSLLDRIPNNNDKCLRELRLHAAAGPAYCATTGYASPEVERAYHQAGELCKQVGDIPERFQILWGHYAFYVVRADLTKALDSSQEMLEAAENENNINMQLEANVSLGLTQYFVGNVEKAYDYMAAASRLDQPDRDRSFTYLCGQDATVCNLVYTALILWIMGKPGQALNKSQKAVALARELKHAFSLAYALNFSAWLNYMLRNPDNAADMAEEEIKLSEEQGFFWVTLGDVIAGWSQACKGKIEQGLNKIQTGLQNYRAPGARLSQTLQLAIEADVCLQAGKLDQGMRCLAEAITAAEQTNERFWLAEIYRLKGETLHAMGDANAESFLQKAIEVAKSQGAKMLLLRAAVSLTRLADKADKPQALSLLQEARSAIEEDSDTPDLRDADLLLEKVAIYS